MRKVRKIFDLLESHQTGGNPNVSCLNKNQLRYLERKEVTSALAGFHAGPLAWSNWNLEMLVFVEGGKPENPEKNPRKKGRTNSRLDPHMAPGQNRT